MDIREEFRVRRIQKALTQAAVSRLLRVDQASISRVESDRDFYPSGELAIALAATLGIDPLRTWAWSRRKDPVDITHDHQALSEFNEELVKFVGARIVDEHWSQLRAKLSPQDLSGPEALSNLLYYAQRTLLRPVGLEYVDFIDEVFGDLLVGPTDEVSGVRSPLAMVEYPEDDPAADLRARGEAAQVFQSRKELPSQPATKVMEALSARLPARWKLTLSLQKLRIDSYRPDAVLAIRGPDGAQGVILAEVRAGLTDEQAADLAPRLAAAASQAGVAGALLVTRFASTRTRQRLRDAGVSYLDQRGNAWIELEHPMLLIETHGVTPPVEDSGVEVQ